jgi:acyl-CoA thioester hydrolase
MNDRDSGVLGSVVIRGEVLPEWIDMNQHMNVAYYVLAFDSAVDALWERFGITRDSVNITSSSTFAVDSHITWQQEMVVGEPYVITSQILAYDEKRIHQFMRMYHAEENYLASTAEWLNLHVDLTVRKVAPWPENILGRIAEFAALQAGDEWPAEAGRIISVPRPLFGRAGATQ